MKDEKHRKNRKTHMDFIRIVAIFFVVYNHTNEKGFFLFAITENEITRPIYTGMSILCTVAVPLFFMVSGGLLLNKEESLADIYKRRVLRIVEVIILFSIFQQIYFVISGSQEFSLEGFIKTIIFDKIIIPYWYLYAYLAYLMILPFLRRLAQNLKNQEFIYLFTAFFVLHGVTPYISYFFDKSNINLSIPIFQTIVIYPLAGYFMEFRMNKYSKKIAIVSLVSSSVALAVMVVMTWKRAMDVGELSEYGNGLFITSLIGVLTFTIYYLIKYFCKGHQIKAGITKVVSFISGTIFGVYLVEERIRESSVGIDIALAPVIGYMPACLVWVTFVVVTGVVITAILKQIPGIKALL